MQSDYHFWQDLFDTYQSLSDAVKLAWLVAPLAMLLLFAWLRSLSVRAK